MVRSVVLAVSLALNVGVVALADSAVKQAENEQKKVQEDAVAAGRAGDWGKAVVLWERAVRDEPNDTTAHKQLAHAFSMLGRYEEAIEQNRYAVKLAPKIEDNWTSLCRNQILAKYIVEARRSCEKALELDPTSWLAAVSLGHTWLLAESFEKAKPFYLRALGYIPDEESIESGPLADFDSLIGWGWQKEAAAARDWFKSEAGPYLEVLKIERDVGALYTSAEYDQAIIKAKEALLRREQLSGHEHPTVATSHHNIAVLLFTTGRYAEAEPFYHRALAIEEKAFGPNHSTVAGDLNSLAELLDTTGRYAEAEPLYRRALAIREKALGSDNPDVATSLNDFAELLGTTGRYAEAEPLYRRALAIREKALGPNHPDVVTSLKDFAELLDTTGRYAEAEPLYRRVLAIREKALGPSHPDVATSLDSFAELLKTTGRYSEAEPLYRRALAIREDALGPDNPYVAASLSNFAGLLLAAGRYAEAEPLYRRALAIDEKSFGPSHSDVATCLNNLAELLDTTGRYSEAEPLFRRAVAIREKALGPNHPDVAQSLNNLAGLLSTAGRYAEAEPLYRRALAIAEKAFGPSHPHVATCFNNLAELLGTTGRYAEAEPLHRKTLAIREKALGPNHPDVATSLNNLASLLKTTGRSAEAEPLLLRAYQIASPAGEPELLHNVQSNLMEYYKIHNPRLAIFYGKQAVNTLQSLRAGFASTERATQQAYTASVSETYQSLADLLIDQGRLPEAEQVLAMLKEQEYFDFVRRVETADARQTQASYNRAEAPWAKRYAEINGRLVALSHEQADLARIHSEFRTPEQSARLAQLDRDLDSGRAEVLAFVEELQQGFQRGGERVADFDKKELEALASVQATLAGLHHNAVLIHYFITPERLRILLTTSGVQLHRDSVITEAELNRLITRYRAVLQNPQQDPLALAQQLYQVLVQPIQKDLDQAGAKTLMVYLDSNLRYLPLAALHDGKHWLAEDYAVALYTAAARKNLDRPPQTDWRVAGMGVSRGGMVDGRHFAPLPAVTMELTGIVRSKANESGVLPGIRQLDNEFTSQSLVDAIRDRYPVLHLATHFHFAPGGTDADSFLLLGNGQKLTLADVRLGTDYSMDQVDLLTLSACETALGYTQANGNEVEGLGALAQKRGARAVLATLWSVADASTGLFMRTLYQDRQQQQLTRADSLQQAQLAFINGTVTAADVPASLQPVAAPPSTQEQSNSAAPNGTAVRIDVPVVPSYQPNPKAPFAHPYYWAPFILMGNWL